MNRLKPFLMAAVLVAAAVSFVRMRLAEEQAVDVGGWEPVDPSP